MQAPRGKQLKINGNIVNVPADVNHTVGILPRLPSQTGTIKVNLKRRLQYKSSALSLNIRPSKVIEVAMWLLKKSDLYKEEGVVFNEDWISEYNEELLSLSQDDSDSARQPKLSDQGRRFMCSSSTYFLNQHVHYTLKGQQKNSL